MRPRGMASCRVKKFQNGQTTVSQCVEQGTVSIGDLPGSPARQRAHAPYGDRAWRGAGAERSVSGVSRGPLTPLRCCGRPVIACRSATGISARCTHWFDREKRNKHRLVQPSSCLKLRVGLFMWNSERRCRQEPKILFLAGLGAPALPTRTALRSSRTGRLDMWSSSR